MTIFTHIWVSWYETKVFRELTGCQWDTLGVGPSHFLFHQLYLWYSEYSSYNVALLAFFLMSYCIKRDIS